MEDEIKESLTDNTPWTSVDLYYKGFHFKKSVPANVSPDTLIEMVEEYIEKGFEPSWNKNTSQEQLDNDPDWVKKKYVCPTCGADADYKEGISKTGKPWKGIFCKETKEHVAWNATK